MSRPQPASGRRPAWGGRPRLLVAERGTSVEPPAPFDPQRLLTKRLLVPDKAGDPAKSTGVWSLPPRARPNDWAPYGSYLGRRWGAKEGERQHRPPPPGCSEAFVAGTSGTWPGRKGRGPRPRRWRGQHRAWAGDTAPHPDRGLAGGRQGAGPHLKVPAGRAPPRGSFLSRKVGRKHLFATTTESQADK